MSQTTSTTDQSDRRTDFTQGLDLISPYGIPPDLSNLKSYNPSTAGLEEEDCTMNPDTGLFESNRL